MNILYKIPAKYPGVASRLFSFLCVGGLAAVINVLCFTGIYNSLVPSVGTVTAYFSGFLLATEISILTNFALNDCITFRRLRDSDCQRPWSMRIEIIITTIL
ncbi:MAG TPA: GtrA family protein [Ktedonobacteraceae bacterium]|nr:GtrA family protein [Ktedonobacteraceae bacterium]